MSSLHYPKPHINLLLHTHTQGEKVGLLFESWALGCYKLL